MTRNSSHFKKVNVETRSDCDQFENIEFSDDESICDDAEQASTIPSNMETEEIENGDQMLRRSSRVRMPPKHLTDYAWTLDL